jgi:O-succinylbenzoic acid--CoA ligase
MQSLIALDLEPSQRFVDELSRAWDSGDAIFPIDQRLPEVAKKALIEQIKPTHIVTASGRQELLHGVHVEDGDALVVATSGSTGVAKGVVLTHDAVLASARASSLALDVQWDDHWYSCLPLAHVGGLSVVTRSLLMGTQLTVAPRFEPDEVERQSHSCTLISLVPTALQRIDPRKFRAILLGGSKPPTDRPKNVIATYGLTETGSGIVYDGRPLDGVEIKIAEDDEILVRAAMNMRCYRDGSSSVDADGWLHTGDIGWVSDNGVLNVQGRRGDVIVTGSEKVWPEAVEISIASLFKPNQFAVIGIPDSEWGERVVVATTRTDIVLSDIKDLVLKTLPNYCVPKSIHVVESIPQTAIGKIRRVDLRQQLSANN